jgi:hypothetical protein
VLLKRQLAASRREALDRALGAEATAHATLHADPVTAAEIVRRYPTAPMGRE